MEPLFTIKQSVRYPQLFVKKYKRKVFYDNLWNDELVESRGKVLLADGTVVVNPFTKIFNYGENGTTIDLNENCLWVNKINGFMAAATFVPEVGEVVVSTTGSLDSDFVTLAEKYITDEVKTKITNLFMGMTLLFEVCDPSDPHIIEEKQGIYLLGIRRVSETLPYISSWNNELDLDDIAKFLGVMRPRWGFDTFRYIVENNASSFYEGVVVYSQSGTVLKIKTPYYLATKAIARIKDISKLSKVRVDEEFYPLIDYVKNIPGFSEKEEQDRISIVKEFIYAKGIRNI